MKGYCVVQMFQPEEARLRAVEAAAAHKGLALPRPELEEAFLGRASSSKAARLPEVPWEETTSDPLRYYGQLLGNLARIVGPEVGMTFDFVFSQRPAGTLLRVPLLGPGERQQLTPAPLGAAEVEAGEVEEHLDFIQRRRLCMIYLVHNTRGGSVELFPHAAREGEPAVTLPIVQGRVLVFLHDRLAYRYAPKGPGDVAVQAWLLEEPQAIRLDGFEGSQKGLEAVIGGPDQAAERQVHVMSALSRFPGKGYQIGRAWSVFHSQVSTMLSIPIHRWDIDVYWSEEKGVGKSVSRHSGLLSEEEWELFDNTFFGIEDEAAGLTAPCQRVLLEVCFETLHVGGFGLVHCKRGQRISAFVGDCSSDWDNFCGYHAEPSTWREATALGATSATRVMHTLSLCGSSRIIDTACSSSLVAGNLAHTELVRNSYDPEGVRVAVALSSQSVLQPWPYIGLSSAGMVGPAGIVQTFDMGANGMTRGEGAGGLMLKVSGSVQATLDRAGCYVASYVNQDGRSASLTAPNGPSQQACVRGSLREARVAPDDMNITENHGTGTALGDPIEVGSIRAVFAKRPTPLPITTGKSHIGHLESTAGSVGLVKVVATLSHAAVPPNCHLRQLNAHIEIEGFPGQWPTELTDLGVPEVFGGLNSFGFGGTNSRADMWANRLPGNDGTGKLRELKAEHIQRLDSISVLCPRCLGHMDWLSAEATPDVPRKGKLNPSLVRQEGASYEYCSLCYTGAYQFGEVVGRNSPDTGQPVYLVGSWSAWSSFEEMEFVEDGPEGYYVGTIRLGETLLEHFRLVLNKDRSKAIFPVVAKADQRKRVHGPGICGQDKSWLIDGRLDGVPAGTAYQVRFSWSRVRKSVTWAVMEAQPPEPAAAALRHSYSIVSSLNRWQPLEMTQSAEDPGVWEFKSRMQRESEEFLFMRDRDQAQLIYPLSSRAADPSVPVMGPDEGGFLKRWAVPGEVREPVTIQLSVKDGGFTVTASTGSRGSTSWQSPQGRTRHLYYVAGSWDRWGLNEMATDADAPDVHTCRFVMGNRCREEFHILLNQSESLLMYPREPGAAPGQGILCGPDARGGGVNWEVVGPAGQVMEVTLDLGAPDARRAVTCRPCALSD